MKNWIWGAAAAALAASAPVAAWNGRGHMIVAANAWEHLTPQTRAAVGRLLRHNPAFADWTRGVPAADRDRVAFIQAATWPDDIKSNNTQDPMRRMTNGYTSDQITGPNARRNVGYIDCQQHRFWHYKDIPFSPDGTALRPPPSPNIETQILAFAAVIADAQAGDELKAYDLVWLVHLVGDAHQPLHATGRFVSTDPDGDGGGNDVHICMASACSTGSSLHSFWDDQFGGSENVATITTFAHGLPAPGAAQAAILSPATWLNESFMLAQSDVYRAPIGGNLGPFTLTATYRQNALRVATDQAALGGARLANLLNGANIRLHGNPVRRRQCRAGRPV